MVNQDIKAEPEAFTQGLELIPCGLIGCKTKFEPKRKNQNFCSSEHRKEFHRIAKKMGTNLLTNLKEEIV